MKSLLAIFLHLPQVRSKNSQMLTLRALQQRGWSVSVVTLEESLASNQVETENWDGVEILRLPPRSPRYQRILRIHGFKARCLERQNSGGISRLAGIAGERLCRILSRALSVGDTHAAERRVISDAVHQIVARGQPDVLLSLYHPLTSHLVAGEIAAEFELPWLAINKDFYSWPTEFRTGLRRLTNHLKRCRETAALRSADGIAAVNSQMVDYSRAMFPGKPVEELGHCFDDRCRSANAIEAGGPFRLVTVGQTGRYDTAHLRRLFRAVGSLRRQGVVTADRFRLRFVGHGGELVRQSARGAGCDDLLEIVSQRHHAEAFREMQRATCLYFQQIGWGSRRRLAEYIGAGRPILVFPSFPGTTADQALRSHADARIAGDEQELQRHLRDLIVEHHAGGELRTLADPGSAEAYSATSRARQLDQLLERLLDARRHFEQPPLQPDFVSEHDGRTLAWARTR